MDVSDKPDVGSPEWDDRFDDGVDPQWDGDFCDRYRIAGDECSDDSKNGAPRG